MQSLVITFEVVGLIQEDQELVCLEVSKNKKELLGMMNYFIFTQMIIL